MKLMKTTGNRVLRWALAAYVAYAGLVALALSTSILERILGLEPTSTSVEVARGWSFVPGLLELRDVKLRIQDPNVDLKIGLSQVSTRLSFAALFRRELRLDGVSATGVDVQLDLRSVAQGKEYSANREKRLGESANLPPADPWLIHIEGVDLRQFSELRVDRWQFDGNAHISGGFELRSGQFAEIYPSRLDLENGRVPGMADHLDLRIGAGFSRFEVPKTEGNETFRYLDGDVDLKCDFNFRGSRGPLRLKWKVAHGRLLPGSSLALDARPLWLATSGFTLGGLAKVRWNVRAGKIQADSHLDLEAEHLEVIPKDKKSKIITADGVHASLETSDLDLRKPFLKITAEALAQYLHWGVKADDPGLDRSTVQIAGKSTSGKKQRVQPKGPGVRDLKLKGEFVLDGGILSGGSWKGALVAKSWPASVGLKISGAKVETTLFPGGDFIRQSEK